MKTHQIPQSVAVLFSDIQGYSRLNPAQADTFVNGVLRLLADKIKPHRSKLIEINTWGDAIFATSSDIQEIARLALDIRDFFRFPSEHADLILEMLRIRIALDFVEVEIGPNYITGRPKACHGKELTRAARLEPVTAPQNVFVTEAFANHLRQRQHAGLFMLVPFPHDLHLPKGFGRTSVFSLHRAGELPSVEYETQRKKLEAIAPIVVNPWFIEPKVPRHQEARKALDRCQDGDEVCFLCITGRSFISPRMDPGDELVEKSAVAGGIARGVKFRGIVTDPECGEARFRSKVESCGVNDPEKRLLQHDAAKVRELVREHVWQPLLQRIASHFKLKKTHIGLSFNLWLFDDQAIIEPYHFGKLAETLGQEHMCKFSQLTVLKPRDEEYRMLKQHFESLWEDSTYVWPEIHGPAVPRIRTVLNPANLRGELTRRMVGPTDAGSPIRVEHLVSNTLRIGPRLQMAFEEIGGRLKFSVGLHEAKKDQDLDEFVRRAKTSPTDFVLLQLHGIEGEERLLEPFLKVRRDASASLGGRLIVYVHRPEEIILRVGLENNCPYWVAKELVGKKLREADAVVLSGNCFVGEYQEMLPEVPVVSIPLGFVESAVDLDVTTRLDSSAVTFIGSDTTWGEMRHIEDLLNLMQAIRFIDGDLKATGYALGKFDHNCNLAQYRDHPDVFFLSNQAIEAAYSQKAFCNEAGFREWLYQQAPGKLIIRAKVGRDAVVPESISQDREALRSWESRIIDFNVQLYHEILDQRRDPERRGQPKVEYSGTLHKGAPHVLFVVFKSPAMDDVERDEDFRMIQVPMSKGTPAFHEAAAKIIKLIRNPTERGQMLEHNLAATKSLGMNEIAYAFCTLMRHLSEAPSKS